MTTMMVSTVEYRAVKSEPNVAEQWVVVIRCPEGCTCKISGEETIVFGFPSREVAEGWRTRVAADVTAMIHPPTAAYPGKHSSLRVWRAGFEARG